MLVTSMVCEGLQTGEVVSDTRVQVIDNHSAPIVENDPVIESLYSLF